MRVPEIWVVLVPLTYTVLVVAAPLLRAGGHDGAGGVIHAVFRAFCHQLPHRTIFLGGEPMAVCARCFALSAGLTGGGLVTGRLWAWVPRLRAFAPRAWMVSLAMVPMALDGFTQLFGFRESTNTLRVLTGSLLGGVTSLWAVASIRSAIDEQSAGAAGQDWDHRR